MAMTRSMTANATANGSNAAAISAGCGSRAFGSNVASLASASASAQQQQQAQQQHQQQQPPLETLNIASRASSFAFQPSSSSMPHGDSSSISNSAGAAAIPSSSTLTSTSTSSTSSFSSSSSASSSTPSSSPSTNPVAPVLVGGGGGGVSPIPPTPRKRQEGLFRLHQQRLHQQRQQKAAASLQASTTSSHSSSSLNSSKSSAGSNGSAGGFYNNRILERYAARETKRVTLRQLTVFGRNLTEEKLIRSGNYVREELPVRLAHRIRDFQHLPFIVGTNPHIEELYQLYWDAFERFRQFREIKSLEDNREFCDLVESMLDQHLVAIPKLALGIAEASSHMSVATADRFFNEMLRSRIGRRVLAEQHITLSAVFDGRAAQEDGWIGIVNTRCRADDVVARCASLASRLFRQSQAQEMHRHLLAVVSSAPATPLEDEEIETVDIFLVDPPDVTLDGHASALFTYIPDHIEYIIFEILRNSMRFTHETHWIAKSRNDRSGAIAASASGMSGHIVDAEESDVAILEQAWRGMGGGSGGTLEWKRSSRDPVHQLLVSSPGVDGRTVRVRVRKVIDGLPSIRSTVGSSESAITFRISDQGGGIPRDVLDHLWSYSQQAVMSQQHLTASSHPSSAAADVNAGAGAGGKQWVSNHHQHLSNLAALNNGPYTSAPTPPTPPPSHPNLLATSASFRRSFMHDDISTPSPTQSLSSHLIRNLDRMPRLLAGKVEESTAEELNLGLGLPMSRVYANYWGGGMALHSMHGYGTDAYVRIATRGNAVENLTFGGEEMERFGEGHEEVV
ncbi:hypothetical protein HDU97_002061 [Phlyctochytrium planicorne]|nr:hypothetical protein HDU97_002061 [Phlyctochytrium planicorne]